MCCLCSCKEATGRPARFALLTTDRPTVRVPSKRASEHRVVAAEKLHAALRQPAREEPFLRALNLSCKKTEIDSYPKYALSRAKAHSLTDFKPFTQYAAPLCGRRSLDSSANAPAGKWSRPTSERTVFGERSPGQPLNILWQREPLNPLYKVISVVTIFIFLVEFVRLQYKEHVLKITKNINMSKM